jgi:hypothetical protein
MYATEKQDINSLRTAWPVNSLFGTEQNSGVSRAASQASNKSAGVRISRTNISAAMPLYYSVKLPSNECSGTSNCDSYSERGHCTASSCQVIDGGWGNHSTPRIEVNTPDTIERRVNYGLRMLLQGETAI